MEIKKSKIGKYEQEIKTQNGSVIDVYCSCKHFSLYPYNFSEGNKICWHLQEAINPSNNLKLSEIKKELLRKFVNYKCESCGKKDEKLTPHRIKRGREGGKYELRNILMVCSNCHKRIHQNEF